jgi:glutamate synthase domain-containing protein 2
MKSTRDIFVVSAVLASAGVFGATLYWPEAALLWLIVTPYVLLGAYDMRQKKHTILRLYPVIGHLRYLFESIRPEIQQYFVEDDMNGSPVSREFRNLIYQRAKGVRDTRPFGTIFDTYRVGYEWTEHSLNPKPLPEKQTREIIGEGRCAQPYAASRFNISAMSYGALSQHAIRALNRGARMGGFYHNTGEGGLSPYHQMEDGDLVWQIGTGYFSTRTPDGYFDRELFKENAGKAQVKMIEIKLSQGAKPGHGGVLPAAKVTEEIAKIRIVEMGKDVLSPPAHSAFDSPRGLLQFVEELRALSGGKPVGFKLSIGKKSEFMAICKAMVQTGLRPDFITIDGGEGGTGAAPIEFINSVGMPLREALHFAHNALIGFGLRKEIKIIASGKAFSSFHVLRLLALGADLVNSARGMMFALGCIQSRSCHSDTCPTGIATQDPKRFKALDIEDKAQRVARYQSSIIHNLMELVSAMGLHCPSQIRPECIHIRVSAAEIKNYAEIYPILSEGCLLENTTVPEAWRQVWHEAVSESWDGDSPSRFDK